MTDHSAHDHHIGASALPVALGLTVFILVLEVTVGFVANSLALLSDGGHILTDVFSLGIAWAALRRAHRPADETHTFGFRRTGIIAALANAMTLFIIAVVIGFEAFGRIQHVQSVQPVPVVLAAAAAVVVNVFIASRLHSESRKDLNVKAAFLHVTGDIAASVGVIISGVIIALTHAYFVDPLLSFLIAILIVVGAWRIVAESLGILMEATPRGLDVGVISAAMRQVPGVESVHDLHVWSLADGYRLLSAHATVPDQSLAAASAVLSDLRLLLANRFNIQHATIELECDDCTVPLARPITIHERVTRSQED